MSTHPSSVSAASTPAGILRQWHDAVNAGEIDQAVALCSDDVAVQGPRGVGHGRDLVRAWLTRSGIRLHPHDELREVDGRFVVAERARWTATDAPDAAPTEPTDTWCVFTVGEGLLTSIARFATAEEVPAP
ncbi:MAG: nuclear transport factor 2 family protein [Nocardioidaceae bacterium]